MYYGPLSYYRLTRVFPRTLTRNNILKKNAPFIKTSVPNQYVDVELIINSTTDGSINSNSIKSVSCTISSNSSSTISVQKINFVESNITSTLSEDINYSLVRIVDCAIYAVADLSFESTRIREIASEITSSINDVLLINVVKNAIINPSAEFTSNLNISYTTEISSVIASISTESINFNLLKSASLNLTTNISPEITVNLIANGLSSIIANSGEIITSATVKLIASVVSSTSSSFVSKIIETCSFESASISSTSCNIFVVKNTSINIISSLTEDLIFGKINSSNVSVNSTTSTNFSIFRAKSLISEINSGTSLAVNVNRILFNDLAINAEITVDASLQIVKLISAEIDSSCIENINLNKIHLCSFIGNSNLQSSINVLLAKNVISNLYGISDLDATLIRIRNVDVIDFCNSNLFSDFYRITYGNFGITQESAAAIIASQIYFGTSNISSSISDNFTSNIIKNILISSNLLSSTSLIAYAIKDAVIIITPGYYEPVIKNVNTNILSSSSLNVDSQTVLNISAAFSSSITSIINTSYITHLVCGITSSINSIVSTVGEYFLNSVMSQNSSSILRIFEEEPAIDNKPKRDYYGQEQSINIGATYGIPIRNQRKYVILKFIFEKHIYSDIKYEKDIKIEVNAIKQRKHEKKKKVNIIVNNVLQEIKEPPSLDVNLLSLRQKNNQDLNIKVESFYKKIESKKGVNIKSSSIDVLPIENQLVFEKLEREPFNYRIKDGKVTVVQK